MVSKKGALELSMNTIVIIVIGVVLLSLGLIFVRGIFSQTTDLSDKVFANADKELDSLGGSVNNALVLSPETVRLKGGQTSGFMVQVTNLEGENYVGLRGTLTSANQRIICEFADGTAQTGIRTLIPGAEDRINVFVKAQKGYIGTTSCKFTLVGLQDTVFDNEINAIIVVS
ncbi:MAG: hypothetical protein ISS82_04300 [Nanoarchaeota archaeon]|nr:hypothetical protein [Nanoarchaeota archaeon]